MLHFRRPDPLRQRTERTVCRRMRIAAHDRHPGQRRALLRTYDVHDALADVADVELLDAELAAVVVERDDLNARCLVDDAFDAALASGRWDVVIGRRQIRRDAPRAPARQLQTFERLRRRHLVQ